MESSGNYLYYIVKNPYDNRLKENLSLPGVFKIKQDSCRFELILTDSNEGEGPFESLYELRRKSLIYNSINLQKHKDRITKSKNIKQLKEGMLLRQGTSFQKSFLDIFSHITIGKISRNKLEGVHFYNPDEIKIIERVKINNHTGVWSARIKMLNKNTNTWVEKESVTNFFPQSWSVSKTFMESYYAFEHKTLFSGRTYYGFTRNGIKIKFIIDNENRILTFYPEID